MKLKNDKERLAFLDARTRATGWYLWKEDSDLQREELSRICEILSKIEGDVDNISEDGMLVNVQA